MLKQDNKFSNYIRSFASVKLPAIEDIGGLPEGEKSRPIRKIQMYWAILHKAGFAADEARLRSKGLTSLHVKNFDCHFNTQLRAAAYQAARNTAAPPHPKDLDTLVTELEVMSEFKRDNPNDPTLTSTS